MYDLRIDRVVQSRLLFSKIEKIKPSWRKKAWGVRKPFEDEFDGYWSRKSDTIAWCYLVSDQHTLGLWHVKCHSTERQQGSALPPYTLKFGISFELPCA